MNVIFMGTPAFSVPILQAIETAGHSIVCVYSQPPRPKGRGKKVQLSLVHLAAQELKLDVRTPSSLKDPAIQAEFAALKADVAIVVAYGLLLPKPLLDAPQYGCLNIHASQLPRWRGAAPIQRAIMAGDKTTASMIMQMEAGLDTGPTCASTQVNIGADMNAGALHDELSLKSADLIVATLKKLPHGELTFTPQPETGVTYAKKIEKEDCRIDWSLSARGVHNHIRGLSPWPASWCYVVLEDGNKARMKVLESKILKEGEEATLSKPCGSGVISLERVQLAGKKPMTAADLLRGTVIKDIV